MITASTSLFSSSFTARSNVGNCLPFLSLSSISNGGYVASVATRTVCPPRSGTCEAGLAGAAGCWAWGRWQPTAMSATTTSMVATSHLRLTIPIHLPGSLWEHRECFSGGQGTPPPTPRRAVERDDLRVPRNTSGTATRLEGRDTLELSRKTPGDTCRRPGRRAVAGSDVLGRGADVFLGHQGVWPGRRHVSLCAGPGCGHAGSTRCRRRVLGQQYVQCL